MLIIIITSSFLVIALYFGMRVIVVRQWVFRENLKQAPVFGDFLHLITWEPNEGVIIMRNKEIQPSDRRIGNGVSKRGGFKLISPFWGQQVFARISLSHTKTVFDLRNLLSYDKIRIHIKVTINWKIIDLDAVAGEFSWSDSDDPESRGRDILGRGEDFLRIKTERALRSLISKKSMALPTSIKMSKSPELPAHEQTKVQVRFPFDANNPFDIDLDDILKLNLEQTVNAYGIRIDEIISEISLPQNIHAAIEETWQSSLRPVTTAHEAIAKEIEFRTLETLMGTDATTANELLKNFRGSFVLGQFPLIDALLEKLHPNSPGDPSDENKIKILRRGD